MECIFLSIKKLFLSFATYLNHLLFQFVNYSYYSVIFKLKLYVTVFYNTFLYIWIRNEFELTVQSKKKKRSVREWNRSLSTFHSIVERSRAEAVSISIYLMLLATGNDTCYLLLLLFFSRFLEIRVTFPHVTDERSFVSNWTTSAVARNTKEPCRRWRQIEMRRSR